MFNVIHYSIVKPKYYMPTIHVCLSVCLFACLFTVCILFPHTLLIAIAYHDEYYDGDVLRRTIGDGFYRSNRDSSMIVLFLTILRLFFYFIWNITDQFCFHPKYVFATTVKGRKPNQPQRQSLARCKLSEAFSQCRSIVNARISP